MIYITGGPSVPDTKGHHRLMPAGFGGRETLLSSRLQRNGIDMSPTLIVIVAIMAVAGATYLFCELWMGPPGASGRKQRASPANAADPEHS